MPAFCQVFAVKFFSPPKFFYLQLETTRLDCLMNSIHTYLNNKLKRWSLLVVKRPSKENFARYLVDGEIAIGGWIRSGIFEGNQKINNWLLTIKSQIE